MRGANLGRGRGMHGRSWQNCPLSLSDLIFVSRVQTLRDVVLSMRDNLGLEPVQSLRFARRAFGRRGTCIQPLSHGQIESGADL